MTYEEALDYLYSRPVFHLQGGSAYKPGLGNVTKLMAALDNPQDNLRTIHVAGTNGKGSTSHLIAAVFQAAKAKTGLFTSPHLVDFRERIKIDGQMIPKEKVVEFIETYYDLLETIQPSFFETTFAMAMWWFLQEDVWCAVIETGLGGRLDATNIILPRICVVTNIGLDHTEFLGNTLEQIAQEKAGIMKAGINIVVGELPIELQHVFTSKAREIGCCVTFADRPPHYDLPECQLKGAFQKKNVNTVLTVFEELNRSGLCVPREAIIEGIKHVCDLTGLQGRWQEIEKDGYKYILDTGHNSHGISSYINDLEKIQNLHIVFGMVSDKDVNTSLSLLPKYAKYYFTQAQTHRAIPADEMKRIGEQCGLQGEAFATVRDAIIAAREACSESIQTEPAVIFIGGSNYVVGEALQMLQQ